MEWSKARVTRSNIVLHCAVILLIAALFNSTGKDHKLAFVIARFLLVTFTGNLSHIVQNHNRKQYAYVAYYGLYDTISKSRIFNR